MCNLKSTCLHRDSPQKCRQCQLGTLSYQSDSTVIDIIGRDQEDEKAWHRRKRSNSGQYIDYRKLEVI